MKEKKKYAHSIIDYSDSVKENAKERVSIGENQEKILRKITYRKNLGESESEY